MKGRGSSTAFVWRVRGIQANASFVDSNAELDTANIRSTFALTGLSGKNMVLFYEKNALQCGGRNQREGFLQSLNQTQSTEPTFVSPYKQDMVFIPIGRGFLTRKESILLTKPHKRAIQQSSLACEDAGGALRLRCTSRISIRSHAMCKRLAFMFLVYSSPVFYFFPRFQLGGKQ